MPDINILRVVKKHHDSDPNYRLLLLLEGALTARQPDRAVTAGSGDLILLQPSDMFVLDPVSSPVVLKLTFEPHMTDGRLSNLLFQPIIGRSKSGCDLQGLMARLIIIRENDCDTGFYKIRAMTSQILEILSGLPGNKNSDLRRVQRLTLFKAYIRQHYREVVTLNEVADYLQLTPQYLSRFIKKHLGITFHDYISQIRLEAAEQALTYSNDTVSKIAFACGFPNPSSLTAVFKARHKLSPQQFRQSSVRNKAGDIAPNCLQLSFRDVENRITAIEHIHGHAYNNEGVCSVKVDAETSSTYKATWCECINLSNGIDLAKSSVQAHLATIRQELGFKFVRFHAEHLINYLPEAGDIENYYGIDKSIDFLSSISMIPHFVFGPGSDRTGMITRPRQGIALYDDLLTGLGRLLRHCINRAGIFTVSSWRFEYQFALTKQSTRTDIELEAERFSAFSMTIRSLLPDARIGGPGIRLPEHRMHVNRVIDLLASLSACPDFFTIELFTWNWQVWDETIASMNKVVRHKLGEQVEFQVAAFSGSMDNRNMLNDDNYKAAWMLRSILTSMGQADSIAYWLASDISADVRESGSLLFGGNGLLNNVGIKKPAFFALSMLGNAGRRMIEKGAGYLVTSSMPGQYEVLLYNIGQLEKTEQNNFYVTRPMDLDRLFEDERHRPFSVTIEHVQPGRYRIRKISLNRDHGSILSKWLGLSQLDSIHQHDLAWLDQTCQPNLSMEVVDSNGQLTIDSLIAPHGVDLFVISYEL